MPLPEIWEEAAQAEASDSGLPFASSVCSWMNHLTLLGFCFLLYSPSIWTQYFPVLGHLILSFSQGAKDRWLGRLFIYSKLENFQRGEESQRPSNCSSTPGQICPSTIPGRCVHSIFNYLQGSLF